MRVEQGRVCPEQGTSKAVLGAKRAILKLVRFYDCKFTECPKKGCFGG
jgi:hypothetical protein